ncbi:MAG: hypothetical protein ABIA04_07970 [Pseudomonadota bacterium]
MNKLTVFLLLIISLFLSYNLLANESKRISFGSHLMFGGRYDNLRMCVGSPAGTPGGPIADIMFDAKFKINEILDITVNLPVARPILFALAFDMLQFEPSVTFEYRKNLKENLDIVYGPGLGLSFHYGPDYNSDMDNRGANFFAIGPIINIMAGISFEGMFKQENIFGIRTFYTPLFAENRSNGTVLGGALEYYIYF